MSNWLRRCVPIRTGRRRRRRPDISGPTGPVYHEGWRGQNEVNMGMDPGFGAELLDPEAGGYLMDLRGIGPVERDMINVNRDMAVAAQRHPREAPPSPGALGAASIDPAGLAGMRQQHMGQLLAGYAEQEADELEADEQEADELEAAVQAAADMEAAEEAELAACQGPHVHEPYIFSPPPPSILTEPRNRFTGHMPGGIPSPHLRPIPYEADDWDPNYYLDETCASIGTSFMGSYRGSSECLATPLPQFSPYGDDEYINEEDECTYL